MDRFIHIRSSKFPILPGEEDELVNEGMYGKALAEYLQVKLQARGYDSPFVCCEDWGWWVELKSAPFAFGVCVYCGPDIGEVLDLFCTTSVTASTQWSWRRLRFVDTRPFDEKLHADLVSIFKADSDVVVVSTSLDSPFPGGSGAYDPKTPNKAPEPTP